MPSLNDQLHEVCEYEGIIQTRYFRFRPGSFELYLGLDNSGYTYQLLSSSIRQNNSFDELFMTRINSRLIDSFHSAAMTEFSSRLIGALGRELARYDSNLEVAEWLKGELKEYLFDRRGVLGTVSYHWNKRKTQNPDWD